MNDTIHTYEPVPTETITDGDGIQEIVISPTTLWVALCEDGPSIMTAEYNALKYYDDAEHCYPCMDKVSEHNEYIASAIEHSRPIRARIGKALMSIGVRLRYGH